VVILKDVTDLLQEPNVVDTAPQARQGYPKLLNFASTRLTLCLLFSGSHDTTSLTRRMELHSRGEHM
jgi:hypothetical protein